MFREEPNPRKKKPKTVAVINTDGCTGCEVCIDFCPVDCIDILPGPQHKTLNKVVIVNEDVCIGCSLCAKYCPWETIDMLSYEPRVEEQEAKVEELKKQIA
jgi:NAD-dependent dihydropyrimidine dehydrogenase PreA subunit